MEIEIITPEKKLFEGSILSVLIPGTSGEFEILNNHAPVISNLKSGTIRVIDENNHSSFHRLNFQSSS